MCVNGWPLRPVLENVLQTKYFDDIFHIERLSYPEKDDCWFNPNAVLHTSHERLEIKFFLVVKREIFEKFLEKLIMHSLSKYLFDQIFLLLN